MIYFLLKSLGEPASIGVFGVLDVLGHSCLAVAVLVVGSDSGSVCSALWVGVDGIFGAAVQVSWGNRRSRVEPLSSGERRISSSSITVPSSSNTTVRSMMWLHGGRTSFWAPKIKYSININYNEY